MALPKNDEGKERARSSSSRDGEKREAPEERGRENNSNPKLENLKAGRKDSEASGKSNKSKRKPQEELTVAEVRAKKARKKRNTKLAAIITGVIAIIAISFVILTVDLGRLFNNDNEGRGALTDDGSNISGRGALTDDGGGNLNSSDADPDAGFPITLDDHLQSGYDSFESQSAMSNFEEQWLDSENWEPLESNIEGGGVSWGIDDWDEECNAPIDPRRGSDYKSEEGADQGWVYRDTIECDWRTGYIGDVSSNWPSREMGYTNNPELEVTDDGLNPYYSYVLSEDVQWFFGHSLQRLLNPVYGGWFYYHQETDNESLPGYFKELFTEDWWSENIDNGDVSNLPIYADWNGDNYGGVENIGTYGWFGEVTDTEFFIEVDDTGSSIIEGTIYLEYKAFSGDSVISRDAELDIQIVPNRDNLFDINNRMIINHAELRVSQ